MNARNHTRIPPGPVTRALLALPVVAVLLAVAFAAPAAAAAGKLPLSPSDYEVDAICATPAPGYSGCLGLRLVPDDPSSVPGAESTPQTAESQAAESQTAPSPDTQSPNAESQAAEAPSQSPEPSLGSGSEGEAAPQATEFNEPIRGSLTPANLLSAYGLAGATPPSTQTIALVDAYDDATIAADLEVFDKQFGLPACNEANGCFRKVNQNGKPGPLPASSGEKERGWAQEIATDVEIAHGVCQSSRILLVEAKSNANSDLYAAEQTAVAQGATEISNSWGGQEPNAQKAASIDNTYFNHPGIVITASSGDYGYLDWFSQEPSESANYPASSPHVIAVGGTRLTLSSSKSWESEAVWNDGGASGGFLEGAGASGGGCSGVFAAPSWQQSVPDWSSVGCDGQRAVADVSADGDPYSGVAIYDSTENTHGEKGWGAIGGTSVASPIVASIYALAGGAQGLSYPAQLLYENLQQDPAALHDVTVGSNGECLRKFHKNSGVSGCTSAEDAQSCEAHLICLAAPGYDGPSGVGTPNGVAAVQPPVPGGVSSQTAVGTTPKAASPAPPVTGASSPGAKGSPGTSSAAPVVSALGLTRSAIAALRKRPRISRLGIAFTLNVAAHLRVTLARRVRVHGRLQWRTVSASPSLAARRGRQTRRLSGRAALARGRYMLTVAPERGAARSIVFQIG
ncbi:MAG TPA: hypothetical protein VHW67_00230 [Solirubrobacteraceae bacterium]|jgi:hypothetical protein|nr:hypothetical protein [Solirubrobacteraceae bacterium]